MTEQNKELFKEFVAFCESQPEDKRIDHYSFQNCAIGEFADSIEHYSDYLYEFAVELVGYETELFQIINYAGCNMANIPNCPNTYGEFTKLLKTYL